MGVFVFSKKKKKKNSAQAQEYPQKYHSLSMPFFCPHILATLKADQLNGLAVSMPQIG